MTKIRKNRYFLIFDIQYGSQVKTRFPQIFPQRTNCQLFMRLLSKENFRVIKNIRLLKVIDLA